MKPIILLNYDIPHGYTFINSLKEKLSLHYDIRWCGNIKDSELYNVKVIIVWQTLITSLDRFINLEKVLICGSGVDEIIKSLNISSSIQLIRLVDESLREKVTSKKGVTSEALQILEKNNLDNILGGAFNAAHKRTLELRKGI